MSAVLNHRYARRIRELLGLRLTHDKIARRLGMCPSNVGKIARQLEIEFQDVPEDSPPGYDPTQLRRCLGCGGMVYLWPCLACGVGQPGHMRQEVHASAAPDDELGEEI